MRLAVFDVGGTAIKYAAMTDGEMDGKGEVPTPATCSGDFLAAIEGVARRPACGDGAPA